MRTRSCVTWYYAQEPGRAIDDDGDPASHDVRERLCGARIGDEAEIDAGSLAQQLARHVRQ